MVCHLGIVWAVKLKVFHHVLARNLTSRLPTSTEGVVIVLVARVLASLADTEVKCEGRHSQLASVEAKLDGHAWSTAESGGIADQTDLGSCTWMAQVIVLSKSTWGTAGLPTSIASSVGLEGAFLPASMDFLLRPLDEPVGEVTERGHLDVSASATLFCTLSSIFSSAAAEAIRNLSSATTSRDLVSVLHPDTPVWI